MGKLKGGATQLSHSLIELLPEYPSKQHLSRIASRSYLPPRNLKGAEPFREEHVNKEKGAASCEAGQRTSCTGPCLCGACTEVRAAEYIISIRFGRVANCSRGWMGEHICSLRSCVYGDGAVRRYIPHFCAGMIYVLVGDEIPSGYFYGDTMEKWETLNFVLEGWQI